MEIGDYEQRDVIAAFSEPGLAEDYAVLRDGRVVDPIEVLDRAPVPLTRYERAGLVGTTFFRGGTEESKQWPSDDNFCPEAAVGRVDWWHGKPGPIYVEVWGSDQAAVDREYVRLMDGVNAGTIVPEEA